MAMERSVVFRNISVEGPVVTPEELGDRVEEVRAHLLAERVERIVSEDTVARLVELVIQDPTEEDQ